MPYVYSTATCGANYVEYAPSNEKDGINRLVRKVSINGGHGLCNKQLFTPRGVATKVSDEDLEFLLKNDAFKRHLKAGFVSYEKTKRIDPERKARDMNDRDGSAPLLEKHFEKNADHDGNPLYKGTFRNK